MTQHKRLDRGAPCPAGAHPCASRAGGLEIANAIQEPAFAPRGSARYCPAEAPWRGNKKPNASLQMSNWRAEVPPTENQKKQCHTCKTRSPGGNVREYLCAVRGICLHLTLCTPQTAMPPPPYTLSTPSTPITASGRHPWTLQASRLEAMSQMMEPATLSTTKACQRVATRTMP